jgi:hypothetical protein
MFFGRTARARGGEVFGIASTVGLAGMSDGAGIAARRAGQADGLAQFHQGLIELARSAVREQGV